MKKDKWRERCLKAPNLMFGKALNNAKLRASKRSLPFNLTREYITNLFDSQDGKCYYSGIKMNIVKSNVFKVHDPFKMTLDCVDPKLGYIEGNVVWCLYCINALKLEMSKEEMFDVCSKIAQTLKV